jgi:hypothetical protein
MIQPGVRREVAEPAPAAGGLVGVIVARGLGSGRKTLEDFGVEDGRADAIDTGGPLAEVDALAAVAAEGKVRRVFKDERVTGWAMEDFYALFCHGRGLLD